MEGGESRSSLRRGQDMGKHSDIPQPTWREAGYLFVNGQILRIERRGSESRTVRLEAI